MLTLKMAWRNVFRQRRRSTLTGLSMTIGFFLAAVFIGWSDGSYNDIIDTFTRSRLGHIQIHEKTYLDRPSLYKTIDDVPAVSTAVESISGISSWTPRLYSAGLAAVDDKSAGVQIIGVDPVLEEKTTNFAAKVTTGRNLSPDPAREVLLGKGLAEILKAEIGDDVVIVSQAADGSIANDLYRLVGIVASGNDMADRTSFYLHLKDGQELLVLEGRVHEIAVTVDKLNQVLTISRKLGEKIDDPDLLAAPWQVFAKSFYDAMQVDKEGMWIMLLIIILIVAVGVLNTVLMSVLERRREYGLLKAVGTKPSMILRLVLIEVIILAVVSIVIGSGLGLAANSYMSTHGFKISSIYKDMESFTYGGMTFDVMRTEVNLRSFLIPAVTVLLCAGLISLFPALKAARTEPAQTMRIH